LWGVSVRKILGFGRGLSGVALLVLMATPVEENNVEYDSDPEEAKRPLTMRRREASDDEEEAEGEEVTDKREVGRVEVRSEDDIDDEGGVEDYANDGDDVEEGEEELQEEEEEEEEVEEMYEEKGASWGVEAEGPVVVAKESDDYDVRPPLEDSAEDHSEEKKESDPFAVPTAGAFYMHDDRFRDNAGTRNRYVMFTSNYFHYAKHNLVEYVHTM